MRATVRVSVRVRVRAKARARMRVQNECQDEGDAKVRVRGIRNTVFRLLTVTVSRTDAGDKPQEHHDGATLGTESLTLVHAGDADSSHGKGD